MVRLRRIVLLPLLALLVLGVAGCKSDAYTVSMKASLDVSNAVSDGIKVLGQLNQDGLINKTELADYAGYLGSVTTANQKFRQDIRVIHSSKVTGKAEYLSAASTFASSASDPQLLAALHVVNPKAQAKVQTVVQSIQTVLAGIQTAINLAKGA